MNAADEDCSGVGIVGIASAWIGASVCPLQDHGPVLDSVAHASNLPAESSAHTRLDYRLMLAPSVKWRPWLASSMAMARPCYRLVRKVQAHPRDGTGF